MKSSAKKVELASVDDLFSTEESRLEERLEKIQEIPLSELHPFKNHPFLHNCTTLKGIQLCRPRCHLQVSLTVSRMMTPRCRKRWIVLKSAVFVRLALCALTRMVAMRLFLAIAATEPASWQVWRICQSLSGI